MVSDLRHALVPFVVRAVVCRCWHDGHARRPGGGIDPRPGRQACAIPAVGTAIAKILPPVSRFGADGNHAFKKQTVLDKLAAFFDRYFGLV